MDPVETPFQVTLAIPFQQSHVQSSFIAGVQGCVEIAPEHCIGKISCLVHQRKTRDTVAAKPAFSETWKNSRLKGLALFLPLIRRI